MGRAEKVNPPALVVKEVALTVALPVPSNTLSVDRLDSERDGDAEEEGYALALPLKESPQEPVDKAEAVVVGVKLAHPVEDTVLVGAFTVGEWLEEAVGEGPEDRVVRKDPVPPRALPVLRVTVGVGGMVCRPEPVGLSAGVRVPPTLRVEKTLALGLTPVRLLTLEEVAEELTLGDLEKEGDGEYVGPAESVGSGLAVKVALTTVVKEGVGWEVEEELPTPFASVPVTDRVRLKRAECVPMKSRLAEGGVVLDRDREVSGEKDGSMDPLELLVSTPVKDWDNEGEGDSEASGEIELDTVRVLPLDKLPVEEGVGRKDTIAEPDRVGRSGELEGIEEMVPPPPPRPGGSDALINGVDERVALKVLAMEPLAVAPPEAVPPTSPPTPPSGDGVMRMDPETLPQRVGETLGLSEDTPKEGVLLALPLGISTVGVGVVCPEKLTRELGV